MARPFQVAPDSSEYAPYYATYVTKVMTTDVLASLEQQVQETAALLRSLPPETAQYRYQPGKWTVSQVVGHIIDAERIFVYRALRFARGDSSPLLGFDQEPYVVQSGHDQRSLESLLQEWLPLRASNVAMFRHLSDEAWLREGIASDYPVTVRAMAWIIAGHELHHRKVIRERYLRLSGASA